MIIGAVSDTHGNFVRMSAILQVTRHAEILLHAGDFYEDARRLMLASNRRIMAVTGNCDLMVKGPLEELIVAESRKVYVTHGHLYYVKRDLSLLIQRAKTVGADVVVFGHTHSPAVFRREGILFVNPGSPESPRGAKPSCALLDVSRSGVEARICYLIDCSET